MAKSNWKYTGVSKRVSTRTKQDNAKCGCCGRVYNSWNYLDAAEEKCYECHGYTFETIDGFFQQRRLDLQA